MWRGADLALVEAVIRDLRGVETEPPLVRAGVVEHLDPVARRVHERVHGQQPGVAVTDPGNLKIRETNKKINFRPWAEGQFYKRH